MPGNSFEMSESTEPLSKAGKSRGVFLSLPMALCMLLLALAIAVGIAVIVYFAAAKPNIACTVPEVRLVYDSINNFVRSNFKCLKLKLQQEGMFADFDPLNRKFCQRI